MRDAFDVLTACGTSHVARARGDDPTAAPATGAVDAAELVEVARSHGMLGLLAQAWNGAGATPDALARAVRDAWRLDAPMALHAARVMGHACEALAAAGVRALGYKGPALALAAYGDATWRCSEDVDVVVRPEDRDRAAAVLGANGYAPLAGASWPDARDGAAWLGHAVFAGPDQFPVELHWRFCTRKLPWSPPVADVLGRAETAELGGRRLLVPEPHDAVVLVLLHAARHGWDRLESIVAAGALSARGIDGDLLLARAAQVHGTRAVLIGLELAHQLLRAVLPPSVERAIQRDGRIAAGVADAARRLRTGNAGTARDQHLHLSLLESAADRARYSALAFVDPTPDDYRWIRLPRGLRGLYFVIRPVRLAVRAGARR